MAWAEDSLSAAEQIAEVFESLGVRYLLGGSMAAAVWSEPRFTRDVDMVAELTDRHVAPLLAALGERWYADEVLIRGAIARRSSFNVIRLERMVKVDVFVPPDGGHHAAKWSRARAVRLARDSKRTVATTSAEDMLLQKIVWFRDGGEVSEQQWRDVVALIRTLGEELDWDYLRSWAERLVLGELLERARRAAAG
ncbi:MAG: hypothetical protein JNN27_16045 [Planctomycetes bacterium]|nr:hypothetical protein [Planctomycetota bacterium]